MDEGKDLIKYFCQSCKPTSVNSGRTRNLPIDAPEKWADFKEYNKRDVEVEMQIQQKLAKFPVPESVWDEYHLSEEINDRGICVDLPFVKQAISFDEKSRTRLTAAMQELTALDNPNSVPQMKAWLADNGMETDTLGKKAVAELLKDAPNNLGDVLLLRQQLAKSSVKKYTAMQKAVCADGRARGMFMFYGANRTGRFSGRLVQLQNLPQNHIPDLAEARALVEQGNYAALDMLYEEIPDTLSQLVRTAFIPKEGMKFVVSDFSAIEARVIAWIAGETWKSDAFAKGEDIYCATASQMFHVPVVKHGINGELRQKGKVAELACIAEGQLVLTDSGVVPIEKVTTDMRVWDGGSWVRHDGVVYRGERNVIEYEGLTATIDHLVWVEGQPGPIQFGIAAACGAHLVQTGDDQKAIWLGENHLCRETLEQNNEPLLCSNKMHWLWQHPVAGLRESHQRKISRLSELLTTETNTALASSTVNCGEATLRKPSESSIFQLWRERHPILFSKHHRGRPLFNRALWPAETDDGDRPHRQQFGLCRGEFAFCDAHAEQSKQTADSTNSVRSAVLAVCKECCDEEAVSRTESKRNNPRRGNGGVREEKELANHQRTARLYDIRNAGEHHRFTVSGKLVHNCGYGGSVGALTAMGALDMGLAEEELHPLVTAWRTSNPHIVKLWWDIDSAVKKCVKEKTTTQSHGIQFSYQSGFLFITLPSGRRLAYVKPRIGVNKFGGECVTYEGVGSTKKWERIDSYGPKFVENIVQATARDILCYAMQTLRSCAIVAHVHDEIIIECDKNVSKDVICEQMGRVPPWAKDLLLRADGYECEFYKKD
ncbi:MAG: DNA polymerase [Ruthenibacterium sp.]